MNESAKELDLNPDGRLHPVFYEKITVGKNGTIRRKRVQIVETGVAILPYKAIDPETGNEKPLGKSKWVDVYALLNKEPPYDLARRVKLYYQTKTRKAQEKQSKSTPIETPV